MAARRGSVTVWLIRRGESAWQAEGRVQGATDLPLSADGRLAVEADSRQALGATSKRGETSTLADTGVEEAESLARPHVSTVYHASDEASTATAHIIARQFGARCREVGELADPNLGLLEGLTGDTFAERYPTRQRQWESDLLSVVPPEGEPIADARRRILSAVLKIIRRGRADELAIVLSPYGLAFARAWLGNVPVNELSGLIENRPRIERYAVSRLLLGELESGIESPLPD